VQETIIRIHGGKLARVFVAIKSQGVKHNIFTFKRASICLGPAKTSLQRDRYWEKVHPKMKEQISEKMAMSRVFPYIKTALMSWYSTSPNTCQVVSLNKTVQARHTDGRPALTQNASVALDVLMTLRTLEDEKMTLEPLTIGSIPPLTNYLMCFQACEDTSRSGLTSNIHKFLLIDMCESFICQNGVARK
jgi:hypothetical protein